MTVRRFFLPVTLAVLGFALVLGIIAYPRSRPPRPPVVAGLGTDQCLTQIPAPGGFLIEGVVGQPRFINPLLSDSNPIDRHLADLVFDGLTRYDDNGRFVPALAQDWTVSEDGLAVRFRLREGLRWHDGESVTVADVAFTYGLLQDPNFSGSVTLGRLWQSVTINVVDETVIEFILPQPYSPFLEATTRGILPSHLLEDVDGATLAASDFNDAPVGTGPFRVDSSSDWHASGQLRLLPNPDYWGENALLDGVVWRFYENETALQQAFAAGDVHTMVGVTPTMVPTVAAVPETDLFTDVAPRLTQLYFNVAPESTSPVAALSVRQALALAVDRDQLVDAVLNGQGVRLEGPLLPSSWAYNQTVMESLIRDVAQAATLLNEAGWVAATEGGARQQGEARLAVTLVALDTAVNRALTTQLEESWRALGVETAVELADDLTDLRGLLAARAFDVALVEVAPPHDPDLYDFWSQEAIVRGQNFAGWNNRRASESMESARQLWVQAERRPYYNTFLRLFQNDLPALTLYQPVATTAVGPDIQGLEMGRIINPRDRYRSFADWYLNFTAVDGDCEETTG